jgi:hypothetical protein
MSARILRSGLLLMALSPLALCTGSQWSAAQVAPAKGEVEKMEGAFLWGKPVDGLVCRLTLQPSYAVGQPITATIEIKNISNKNRFIIRFLELQAIDYVSVSIDGPKGNVRQTFGHTKGGMNESWFGTIARGEVKRIEIDDLRYFFDELDPFKRDTTGKAKMAPTGKFKASLRFRSPVVPAKFEVKSTNKDKQIEVTYKDASPYLLANHWAGEIEAMPLTFELQPLAKEDWIVHEWGVFTVLNDAKYANANRKEEWGNLPTFFYRQFPTERLRWVPSGWDKPLVYFYSKPPSLLVRATVTFAEGAPVVWWPAAAWPVNDTFGRKDTRPFRSLTWEALVGDVAPGIASQLLYTGRASGKLQKVEDFPLPDDCWLQQARLPGASRLTVVGNIEGKPKVLMPGSKDRNETERFLYYDGLVPAPDYLFCEKVDGASLTLRNSARFDLGPLFIVDRRLKGRIGFAILADDNSLRPGKTRKIEPRTVAIADWPAEGIKALRKALLRAGLFEPEADSLLKIWHKQFFEAEGLIAFHLLPQAEYDRMLPLEILPAPVDKPVRVGIALHPNLEIEPALAERAAVLIGQLDDAKFQKREAAAKALLEMGPRAIVMLRAELAKNVSLEMSTRIRSILDRVDAMDWLGMPQIKKAPR